MYSNCSTDSSIGNTDSTDSRTDSSTDSSDSEHDLIVDWRHAAAITSLCRNMLDWLRLGWLEMTSALP